jgi:hypothetical protein
MYVFAKTEYLSSKETIMTRESWSKAKLLQPTGLWEVKASTLSLDNRLTGGVRLSALRAGQEGPW